MNIKYQKRREFHFDIQDLSFYIRYFFFLLAAKFALPVFPSEQCCECLLELRKQTGHLCGYFNGTIFAFILNSKFRSWSLCTGIEVRGDVLRLNPQLPLEMERLDMKIRYRGHSLDLRLHMTHSPSVGLITRQSQFTCAGTEKPSNLPAVLHGCFNSTFEEMLCV